MPKKTENKAESKIGLYLEQEATKRNLSQRALAMKAGLNPATVSHIISGRRKADIEVCVKLAEYLKVDPCYLLELAGRLPLENEQQNHPEWIRNLLYRLNNRNYSKRTIDMINRILDQEDEEIT